MTGHWVDVDDAALLRAHVRGDRDAFAELVRRHRDRLWAVALRTLGDREDAADAVQDALLSAYRSADRFRGDSAVTTWLHRIVVNACLDRARRRQARPTVALPEIETVRDPVAPDPDTDTALAVQAALAQLPAEQRVPLVLLDMQGYSVAEIADDARCRRGHREEPVRPRSGSTGRHARPSAWSDRPTRGTRRRHRTSDHQGPDDANREVWHESG